MRKFEDFKFRAWDGKKMHYNITPWMWDFVIDRMWSKCTESTGTGILGSGGDTAKFEVPGIRFETIMQYTGLKDNNGDEIYEGDILRDVAKNDYEQNNDVSYEVFFHDNDSAGSHIGWKIDRMHFHGSICGGVGKSFIPKSVSKMIIIGNILAHPELLKS